LINLGIHVLKALHVSAVSESPILKSPILQNSQFAKYNARQIFPLYSKHKPRKKLKGGVGLEQSYVHTSDINTRVVTR